MKEYYLLQMCDAIDKTTIVDQFISENIKQDIPKLFDYYSFTYGISRYLKITALQGVPEAPQ